MILPIRDVASGRIPLTACRMFGSVPAMRGKLVLTTAALMLAGCQADRTGSPSDARPANSDAGLSVEDGAEPEPDAGETDQDAAVAGEDAAVRPDGGAPPDAPIGEADLMRKVSTLASEAWMGRDEGSPGGLAARAWIIQELGRCGIPGALPSGDYEQPITTGAGANVLGWIEGTDPSLRARNVFVSAHYDHLGPCGGGVCLGADDNAAGVAIALGVGCELAASPPARSVVIALWDAEEPPTFLNDDMGSQFYVDHPVIPLADIDAVLVMDLVGGDLWPGFEQHFVFGAELSPELDAALTSATVPASLPVGFGGYHLFEQTPFGVRPLSDYYPFRVRSVPTLFFTNGQNKRYHTAQDVVASVNVPKMAREAEYLLSITRELANAATTPTFVANGQQYARDAMTIAPVLDAALAPGGMVELLGVSSAGRTALEEDKSQVQAILQKIQNGTPLDQNDVAALRSATQRVNCLTGSEFGESICNLL